LYFTEPESLISAIVNIVSNVNSVRHRLKGRSVRKLLLVAGCLLMVAGQSIFAQTNGDYRSKAVGTWTNLATWEIYNGTWAQPTVLQGYPGQNSSPSIVDIFNNVTLDVDLPNSIAPRINDLYIHSGTLELSSHDFTVNGTTNISSILSDNDINGTVIFYGPINVSNTASWTSIDLYSASLLFYGDIVNNSFSVSLSKARASANIVLSGTGRIIIDYFEYNGIFTVTNRTQISVGSGLNSNDLSGATWINEGTLRYFGTDLLMGSTGILTSSCLPQDPGQKLLVVTRLLVEL